MSKRRIKPAKDGGEDESHEKKLVSSVRLYKLVREINNEKKAENNCSSIEITNKSVADITAFMYFTKKN